MEEQMDNFDFGLKEANVKNPKKTIDNVTKSIKCNQCEFASSLEGDLRRHLKTHSGEKSNKCSLCDYVSSQAGNLRTHLKTHSALQWRKVKQMQPV